MSVKTRGIISGLCFFYILVSCQNTNTPAQPAISDSGNNPQVPLEGHFCYSDTTVNSSITIGIEINQHKVNGKVVSQTGSMPVVQGQLQGTITTSGELRLLHQYIMEHHPVAEHLLMKWYPNYLLIKRGELITINGISTYKDESTAMYEETLRVIACPE